MNHTPVSEYLSIEQACEALAIDENQLQSLIKMRNLRLFIYIDGKENPLKNLFHDENIFRLIEERYNSILPSELQRLGNLSDEQLKIEGYSIESLDEPNKSLVKKGSKRFTISHENGIKMLGLPPTNPTEISHDGFIELGDDSFINPAHNIAGLFRGDDAEIMFVKSRKKNHVRHLSATCLISKDDIYIHNSDISKILDAHKKHNEPSNREPKKVTAQIKYRDDAISRATISQILPEILPVKNQLLSENQVNELALKCFECLKPQLEKNGIRNVISKKMKILDGSYIQGREEHGASIHTTFGAFRKRFRKLLSAYLSQSTPAA